VPANTTANATAPAMASRRSIDSSPRITSTNRNGSAVMKYHGVVVAWPTIALLMSA